jgi:hypothetical protein
MKYLSFAIIVLFACLSSGAMTSEGQKNLPADGPPFSVAPSKRLEVFWRGEKLVSGDSYSWLAGQNIETSVDHYETGSVKGWHYSDIWNEDKRLPFRRETGISPDGKRIEINFQSHQDALMESYPSPVISYKIYIPISLLAHSQWDALTGRSYNAKWSSGSLDPSTPDGNFIGSAARWLSFTTPRGRITFDFNPQGVPTYYVTGANTIHSQWTVTKKGDTIEMALSVNATSYGGAVTGKLAIFEGDKNDYLKHHAVSYYHYFSEIPAERLYCFGGRASKKFINAGINSFDREKGSGWKKTVDLKSEVGLNSGALYASAVSTKSNSFISTGIRPGLYLVTIRSTAVSKDKGPFDVSVNGEKVFTGIKTPVGMVTNLTCVRWLEGGKAEIGFDGDWSVSVIGLQLFMHTDEDFEFRRGFWIKSDGFCPDVMFANYYDTPPVYGKSVSFSPLSGKVEDIREIPELPELGTSLPDQSSGKLSWRYTSPLGTMGPDNNGSFNEYNTSEQIEKRLQQIRDAGIEAVIINGFLSRHTFPAHLKRVEENIRQIVDKGHKMGMKFLDHQDLTILWNMDMGFRFLAEHPEFLQHTQTDGLPTWGICPINPLFRDGYFFPYILNHIRNTGLDGIMIDECTFHGSNFCNCAYCRAAFTKATGLVFPDDETNPILRNRQSGLWKAWIEWRKHAIAQWRIDFSRETHKINPGFCNIQYYSEGGFMQDGASYEQGGDLALSARSMDFLGTEIMSRDVWDNYRYNFSSRHMYNSLHETYGSPVFGLVYPIGQINYAIIGWAMNNMLAQVTWTLEGFQKGESLNKYTGWSENMNNIHAKPFADIAIIFSRKTRDWSLKNRNKHPDEVMGISQFFAERHIQHTFILDDALLNQDISRFRVLLAPGVDCVSDEQAEKLTVFVMNGGTLYITGETGRYTSYGEPRTVWPFTGLLENDLIKKVESGGVVEANAGKGRIVFCANRYGINEFCKSYTIDNTYEFSPDPEITALNEKILRQVIGSRLSFESKEMPGKVLTSVYNEVRDGKKVTMIHLLNATGVKVTNGDKLPLPDPGWGKSDRDMSFEISLPSVSRSYFATPDATGHSPVRTQKVSDGRYRVIIPAGTLDKYGIVYLWQ